MLMLYWTSWSAFFAMGGYGFYVWGSVLACAAAWLIEIALLRRQRKTLLTYLRRVEMARALDGDQA